MIHATFAKWFKENRIRLGLTQEKVAELLFQSQQSIWKYEQGLALPRIATLYDLVQLFGTPFTFQPAVIPSKPMCLDLRTQIEQILKKYQLEERIKMKENQSMAIEKVLSQLKVTWGDQVLSTQEIKEMLAQDSLNSTLGKALEEKTAHIIEQYHSTDFYCPHELGHLGNYCCTLMLNGEGLETTVSLSLCRDDVVDDSVEWEWFIYTEVDGATDDLVKTLPVKQFSGEEAILSFVELIEEWIASDELKEFISSRQYVQQIA